MPALPSVSLVLGVVCTLWAGHDALAQPKITSVVPPVAGLDLAHPIRKVTLNGAGFFQAGAAAPARDLALSFDPATAVPSYSIDSVPADTSMQVTLALSSAAQGVISVTVTANGATSLPFSWDTAIARNQCLEAIQSSGCQLRWEIDASGVSGSSSQTNTNHAGNFLISLDYQVAKNKDSRSPASGARSFADRFGIHMIFKTGYTQVPASNLIAPTSGTNSSSSSTATPAACSGTPAASPCIAAIEQNAWIADVKIAAGWSFGQNGQSIFSALGFGARGALQSLLQSNQIVQSAGLPYADLTALNPNNLLGVYEGFFRYRLSEPGHDQPANPATASYENASSLLVIEAGAQYDSGLAHLAPNPLANTRNRIVARFHAYPELPNAKHTKLSVGLEVSAGINGGPKIIQIFWGTNLNPIQLFSH